MAEFYAWPWPAHFVVSLLLALCVLTQTVAVILSWLNRKRRILALLEACILALILFCALLYGQIIMGVESGFIASVGYGALRINIEGRAHAWVFVAAMLFLLARGVYTGLRRYRKLRTGISSLSIQNAVDFLRSGILFSRPDGFVLLANAQMRQLMMTLTGKMQHNGLEFFCMLTAGTLEPGCRKAELEGQFICLLPDGSAWMFVRTELRIGQKNYIELTATDVTEHWELTAQLQRQNSQLEKKRDELKATIANLHILSRDNETQKAKMRTHDILGQRLSLLLRSIRNAQTPDYDLLRSLAQGLMGELAAGGDPSPQDFLENLRREFGLIGVDIRVEGPLPEDCAKGQLFADIVRESVTNAVRHGLATQVLIRINHTQDGCLMRVSDNGIPPPAAVSEGGGLGGIRKKVEAHGGTLRTASRPCFVLEVDLPEYPAA